MEPSYEATLTEFPNQPGWYHFAHGADIGVRGVGRTLEEAFENTAIALVAVITDPEIIRQEHQIYVQCEAPDLETLLLDWLNAIVFEIATRNMIFGRFHVQTEGATLHGTLYGETIDPEKHSPAVEVKGATYTALRVERLPNGLWLAQCV
ncbi:MAG: archease, partial [Candidatus Caldarchaeum sp.]